MKGKLFVIALKKEKLLYYLEKHHSVIKPACEAAGVARSSYYKWLLYDSDFAKSVEKIEIESKRYKKEWKPYDEYFKETHKNKNIQ